MNLKTFLTELLPKTVNYRLARKGWVKPANPITLTFSVTAACQSRCKTCKIGEKYLNDTDRSKDDLELGEIERIFRSMGKVYFFNVSGGEPFLRKDLADIVRAACEHLKPGIVHIPTNALMPGTIERETLRILEIIKEYVPRIQFTVKPSIDGVGELHDEIRGVKGNFEKLVTTIELLKKIDENEPGFHLELGTVISNYNIEHLDEIEDFVHRLGVQSYRNEIAEQREEFFNKTDPITPTWDIYSKLMEGFSSKIRENLKGKRRLARITESFRLVYYRLAVEILRRRTQVIPCYAGISNVHLNYDGGLWPCCTLGYGKPMGDLRESGYDFKKIWHGKRAGEVRKYIADRNCYCPLANQAYSNILCHGRSLSRVLWNILSAGK